jgi:phosphatidylserine decarboxylase
MTFNVFLQYMLPHRALSRVVYWATRWTFAPWKNWLISTIVRNYQVNMAEAAQPDPLAYQHFNAFFTRKLRADARRLRMPTQPPCSAQPTAASASPARSSTDGSSRPRARTTPPPNCLATKPPPRRIATVASSPSTCHRATTTACTCRWPGTLKETVHVPGRIFSVAPFAVEAIPRLFARNERLVCHFEGEHGPFVVVMVGAILVSSVATVWDGLVIPPYASSIRRKSFEGQNITLERFAEMARFNMGSTVILLLPEGMATLDALQPQQPCRWDNGSAPLKSDARMQDPAAKSSHSSRD